VVQGERIKVWDIAVRVFHWSLVLLFLVTYLSGDDESLLHVYSGYGVMVLVAFRMFWGFVGTKHARFADFVYGGKTTVGYARSLLALNPIHYLGHNPLGGWMVVALLVSLLGSCWTGLEAYGAHGQGPLAESRSWGVSSAMAHEEEDRDGRREGSLGGSSETRFWHKIHEAISSFTLFLVILHIAGVLSASAMHRENLVKAMITGYKTRRTP
jgi:cytochrome b